MDMFLEPQLLLGEDGERRRFPHRDCQVAARTVFSLLKWGLVTLTNPLVVISIKAGASEPHLLL